MSKQWIDNDNGNKSVLVFTPFYEDENIAEVLYEEDGGWCYTSELLKAEAEYLGSDTFEDAKEEVESVIESHYESERNYYQELLDKFLGKDS